MASPRPRASTANPARTNPTRAPSTNSAMAASVTIQPDSRSRNPASFMVGSASAWVYSRTGKSVEHTTTRASLSAGQSMVPVARSPIDFSYACENDRTRQSDQRKDRLQHLYSILSAFIGEIDAARPAGIIAAKNAQVARAAAATPRASGSQNETP